MVWSEQWSYKIDGTEVNDRTNFFVVVPELDHDFEQEAIMVSVQGDYPSFIRNQPKEGAYTFIVSMTNCTWATYQTRLATLKAIFSNGIHTFTVQARGMASAKSVTLVVQGITVQAKERVVTVRTIAPKPVFA